MPRRSEPGQMQLSLPRELHRHCAGCRPGIVAAGRAGNDHKEIEQCQGTARQEMTGSEKESEQDGTRIVLPCDHHFGSFPSGVRMESSQAVSISETLGRDRALFAESITQFRLFAFGGYLSSKAAPKDIDLLVAFRASVATMVRNRGKVPTPSSDLNHIAPMAEQPLWIRSRLCRAFNTEPHNVANNIRLAMR